jgi:SpoVK/Ycf46/Vps4 family AAA+-type ATPase
MSNDETKTFDRCIADLHLMRALRPYRHATAYVLVVVLPEGVSDGPWQGAAHDLMKEYTAGLVKAAKDADDYDVCHYRRDHYVDVFEAGDRKVNGKSVAPQDPWETVSFGIRRTVLICRRAEASKVLASKASALADQVIDIQLLDIALVQRAVLAATGAEVTAAEAEEILAMPTELRSVLRKTGRGIRSVLERMRAMDEPQDTAISAKSDDGPRLEDLHGYGRAKDWGLELKRDLEDYAAGRITWDDVDNGLLLSGPPGCGKTTFARALSNSLGAHLVVGSYSAWIGQRDGHQGTLLRGMRDAFKEAREKSPSILLIDEIDNFPQRGSLGRADHDEWNRGIVNGLLECLDGAVERPGVIVIGATNHADGIDTALLRPGRLDRHIEIGLPDAPARQAILHYHLQKPVDVSSIIDRTEGYSGADLERVARDARRMARRKQVAISIEHVAASMPEMRQMTRGEMMATAIHELGHAVVGIHLGRRALQRIVVKKEVFVAADCQVAGFAHFGASSEARRTKAWYEDEIAILLGSIAAERMLLGGHCDGATDDLAKATDAALHMLSVAGFGDGLMADVSGDLSFRRHRLEPQVNEILREQLARAELIAGQFKAVIESLADELADQGALDGETVTRAVRDHGESLPVPVAM